ncbi:MAG: hypothetical protein QXJ14_03540 [Candidatus Aenigmatarchaeota archaeon]
MANKIESKHFILNKLVEALSKSKRIKSIIQIGSSLWDPKSKDIDIIIVTKGSVPTYRDLKFLSDIANTFTKNFGVSFGRGGIFEKIKICNIDLIIIPEKYQLFYSFNPLLIFGMSINPYKVLYGYDFFKKIKGELKANKEMLFKFGGPLANFYFFFILNFNNLTPRNSRLILSMLKIILYPLVFMQQKHVKKSQIIEFLRATYPFFNKLCIKYEIPNNLFYKKRLSVKTIEKIYNFVSELVVNIYHKFY